MDCCSCTEQLDKHPKAVVFILSALGVFVIGVVLTLAFFGNTTLLGVGVTMAVVGGAGAILGCINLMAKRDDENNGNDTANKSIAPPRIPPPRELYYSESYADANRGALYYEPCTSSPSRQQRPLDSSFNGRDVDNVQLHFDDGEGGRGFHNPNEAISGVIFVSPSKRRGAQPDNGFGSGVPIRPDAFPLSPFAQRSYPVPTSLGSPIPAFAVPRRSDADGEANLDTTRRVDMYNVSTRGASQDPPPPSSLPPPQQWRSASGGPVSGVARRRVGEEILMRTPGRGESDGGAHWSPQ